jgi:hypothetical protein
MKIKTVRSAAGLRDVLFEELDAFRNGKVSVKHAQTVVNIARSIIDSSRLEIIGLAITNKANDVKKQLT